VVWLGKTSQANFSAVLRLWLEANLVLVRVFAWEADEIHLRVILFYFILFYDKATPLYK
jgi:hypothetical protein